MEYDILEWTFWAIVAFLLGKILIQIPIFDPIFIIGIVIGFIVIVFKKV